MVAERQKRLDIYLQLALFQEELVAAQDKVAAGVQPTANPSGAAVTECLAMSETAMHRASLEQEASRQLRQERENEARRRRDMENQVRILQEMINEMNDPQGRNVEGAPPPVPRPPLPFPVDGVSGGADAAADGGCWRW